MALCVRIVDPGQGFAREGSSLPFIVAWQPATDGPTLATSVALVQLLEGELYAQAVLQDGSLGPLYVAAGAAMGVSMPVVALDATVTVEATQSANAHLAGALPGTQAGVEFPGIVLGAGVALEATQAADAHLTGALPDAAANQEGTLAPAYSAIAAQQSLSDPQAGVTGTHTLAAQPAGDLSAIQDPLLLASQQAGVFAPAYTQALVGSQEASFKPSFDGAPFQAATAQGAPTFTTGDRIATKDVFVRTDRTLGACNDASNHNTEDIRVQNFITVSQRDGYAAWDLSNMPPGATVTAATLKVNVVNAPGATVDVDVYDVGDAGEGWNEATMTCNTAPGENGSALQRITFNTSTGQKSFTLNAAVLARIQARMGVGSCSLLFRMVGSGTNNDVTFDDRESGSSVGPRLALTFTT